MRTEALSGSTAAFSIDSPQVEQESSLTVPRFIDNKRALTAEIFPSIFLKPFDLYYDSAKLAADFVKGCQEYVQLRRSPVHLDKRIPRGDGSKVIAFGGLNTITRNYDPIIDELRALDWDAVCYPWGVNNKPPGQFALECEPFIIGQAKASGRRVKIIGHSLGGFDELALFIRNPQEFLELVEHVVFDASPRPTRMNKALELAIVLSGWLSPEVSHEVGEKAELLKKFANEGLIKVTSVDSSHDPIIGGQFFGRVEDHFIIGGASHYGLAYHPDSLRVSAFRLAGEEVDLKNYPNISQLPKAA